jgi:hypothetical protein
MSIQRIAADTVHVKCRSCQAITGHALADLRAAHKSVSFPPCPSCKSAIMANVIAGPITKNGSAALMQAWIKTLHQRLISNGHTIETFNAEAVQAGIHDGALVWPEGDSVVEFIAAT